MLSSKCEWYDSPSNADQPGTFPAVSPSSPTVQTVINSSQLVWSRESWALVGYASDFRTSFQPGAWPKYITITSRRSGQQRVFQYKRGIMENGALRWADYHCKQESVILRIYND